MSLQCGFVVIEPTSGIQGFLGIRLHQPVASEGGDVGKAGETAGAAVFWLPVAVGCCSGMMKCCGVFWKPALTIGGTGATIVLWRNRDGVWSHRGAAVSAHLVVIDRDSQAVGSLSAHG